jgi:hypothetical protein
MTVTDGNQVTATETSEMPGDPAIVMLAHSQPEHLARLIAVLAPLPVFLHIDASTPDPVFRQMTAELPSRVRLLRRLATGWATAGLVEAELLGYERALAETDAKHIVVMTGADYPLVSVPRLREVLAPYAGKTLGRFFRLPKKGWAKPLGYGRFIFFNQWPEEGKRKIMPLPRLPPRSLRLSGGSQVKIIARNHAAAVLDVWSRQGIRRYLSTTWIPDETAVPCMLLSPRLSGVDRADVIGDSHVWYLQWTGGHHPKSLDSSDLPLLTQARARHGVPVLFARKFTSDSGPLLDEIDARLRES